MPALRRIVGAVDLFVMLLIATLVVATLLPPTTRASAYLTDLNGYVVALVFWSAGVRLSPRTSWDGLRAWRLHGVVLAITFLVLPALAAGVALVASLWLEDDLISGLLFLGALPSVVQSSVTFVSLARGNVGAAVCTASLSSIVGVVATPLLVLLLIHTGTRVGADLVWQLALQVLAPFAFGQVLHRWLADWAVSHGGLLRWLDRSAILLIVYAAFGGAVADGVWQRLPAGELVGLVTACLVLLAAAFGVCALFGRVFRFPPADRAVITLCGSAKSLSIGLPMSALLFDGALAGIVILPVIIFHQSQLIAGSLLSRAYVGRTEAATGSSAAPVRQREEA